MKTSVENSRNSRIDVKDEREFKLWIKFIASVHKNGGDINKPTQMLWKSVADEIKFQEAKYRAKRRSLA